LKVPEKINSEATIVIDREGNIQSINRAAQSLFGCTRSEVENQEVTMLIPAFKKELIEQTDSGVLLQQYGKHKHGQTFSFFFRLHPFELFQQTYFMIVIQDVKNRSKIEKELYKSLNELVDIKYALDESSIVAVTDHKGIIKYVNDTFCKISKYTHDELIGKDHRIINSGYHSKEFMKKLWRTISSGKVWKGEIKNKAKDGTHYWVDTTIVPFLNEHGKPYQYLAIRTEVTEYKQIQEKLQNSLDELVDLKFALDESSIVAMTDQKGKITYINDKFCEISKYSRNELLGKDHRIINSGYHSKSFFENLWKTISSGEVWKGEIKNKAKDGTYYWVDTTIVPFLDKEGKVYRYLAIRNEVTERKRVEEELQTMMRKMIGLQEEERKKLSRDLHDGIGQNLYSLLITINRLTTEVDHVLLDEMKSETSKIIEEIREISWQLRPSVLDDLGLVPAIRSFISRFSEHFGIRVSFRYELKRRLEPTVETSIYRIIQEALTNIRKYAEVTSAEVFLEENEDHLKVLIRDEGQGFDTKQRTNGIGLFSMEERARSIGAFLNIHSKPNLGTTVKLIIPLEAGESRNE
jgi:two-component system, NarL family, sensor histidine kinase NreB